MYVTTQGLVLRVCPYNDTDAMLTILTADLGEKIRAAPAQQRDQGKYEPHVCIPLVFIAPFSL